MATSGGQPGNQSSAKGKRWRDALLRAMARSSGSVDAGLDKLAEQVVKEGVKGERWAIDHIADRVDGKAAQAIIGGEEDDAPIKHSHTVEFVNGPGSAASETIPTVGAAPL